MAKGDFGPGAQLRQVHIEIDVADDGHVSHAGCGYFVRVPSGKELPGGLTVHSPDGNYAVADKVVADRLTALARDFVDAVRAHEGL